MRLDSQMNRWLILAVLFVTRMSMAVQFAAIGALGSSPSLGAFFVSMPRCMDRAECPTTVLGGLAQMVERVLSMHEAQGSIPWSSTFFFSGHCFSLLMISLQVKMV